MWYRNIVIAEQGVFNPIGPGGIDLIEMIENFFNQSIVTNSEGLKTLDLNKLNSLIQNSFLRNIISSVVPETDINNQGSYNRKDKTLRVNANFNNQTIQNIISTIQHELTHGSSPIYNKYRANSKKYDKWKSTRNPLQDKLSAILDEKTDLFIKKRSGEITQEDYDTRWKLLDDESQKLQIELGNIEKNKPEIFDPKKLTSRGRTSYFSDEEITAQTRDLKNAFKQSNLIEVFEKFYNSDKISFIKDLNKLIATLPLIENVQSQLLNDENKAYFSPNNITNIIQNLPEYKTEYIDALMSGDNSRIVKTENYILAKEQKRILKQNLPQVDFIDKLENVSGIGIYNILQDIKDRKYFIQIRKSLANDLMKLEEKWGLREKHKPLRSELPKQKKQNVFADDDVI